MQLNNKTKKMSKIVLTNGKQSDRIVKLSQDSAQLNALRKKLEKSLKKYLTKAFPCVKLSKLPEKRVSEYH